MSRWISKHRSYSFGIYNETAEDRRRADGAWERVVTRPALVAQFVPIAAASAEDEHAHASQYDLEVARSAFLGAKRADGTPKNVRAIPSLTGGALAGVATVGFNPDSLFGVFDTDWIADENDRALADAKLRDPQWGGIGIDYVEVVPLALTPPWPNYDRLRGKRGATVAERIALKVVEDGYDPAAVAAYEKATKNRDDVLAALAELEAVGAQQIDQDDAAMEAVV